MLLDRLLPRARLPEGGATQLSAIQRLLADQNSDQDCRLVLTQHNGLEQINPEKRHLYSAEVYLKYLLVQREFETALELCQVDAHLFPELINYMVLVFFKEPQTSLLKQTLGQLLTLICDSLDDKDGRHKLACANAVLAIGGSFEELDEVYNSLVEQSPIEFASLLLKKNNALESIDVINSAIKANVLKMKTRAASELGGSENIPTFIAVEQFKQVETRSNSST